MVRVAVLVGVRVMVRVRVGVGLISVIVPSVWGTGPLITVLPETPSTAPIAAIVWVDIMLVPGDSEIVVLRSKVAVFPPGSAKVGLKLKLVLAAGTAPALWLVPLMVLLRLDAENSPE